MAATAGVTSILILWKRKVGRVAEISTTILLPCGYQYHQMGSSSPSKLFCIQKWKQLLDLVIFYFEKPNKLISLTTHIIYGYDQSHNWDMMLYVLEGMGSSTTRYMYLSTWSIVYDIIRAIISLPLTFPTSRNVCALMGALIWLKMWKLKLINFLVS